MNILKKTSFKQAVTDHKDKEMLYTTNDLDLQMKDFKIHTHEEKVINKRVFLNLDLNFPN